MKILVALLIISVSLLVVACTSSKMPTPQTTTDPNGSWDGPTAIDFAFTKGAVSSYSWRSGSRKKVEASFQSELQGWRITASCYDAESDETLSWSWNAYESTLTVNEADPWLTTVKGPTFDKAWDFAC